MAPIYIMAIIATVVAAAVWLGLFAVMAGRFRSLVWFSLLTLPMSLLVNELIKTPLVRAFAPSMLFLLFLAPVTEEAIKALPALLPPIYRRLQETGAGLWTGIYLGLGFGLGEIWFLAWRVAGSSAYASMPWWQFTGFLQERVLVTGLHGIMTAVCVSALNRSGWRRSAGYVGAVLLHALLNLGALLHMQRVIPLWMANVWLLIPTTLLLLLFGRMYSQARRREPVEEQVFFDRNQP